MQHADIGLLPLNDEPSNRGRSPMKLYEYAAAGLPVVARKAAELEQRAGRFIHTCENAGDMIAIIRKVMARSACARDVVLSARLHPSTSFR